MYPLLLELPEWHVRLLPGDVLTLAAVLFCLLVGPRWAAALEGVEARRVRAALLVLAAVTLAGGRLHFLLNHPEFYAGRPLTVLKLWTGSFHIGGGLVALALVAPWVTRWAGVPLGKFGDGIVPAMGISIAIARLGCFLSGCCFGTVCEWPWCLEFPRGSSVYLIHDARWLLAPGATHSAPVHPLQLYFVAAGLLITAMALWLRPRKRYDGQIVLIAFVLFSSSTALIEHYREDYGASPNWGPLPQLVWTALAMLLVSLVALLRAEVLHRRRARLEAVTPDPPILGVTSRLLG